MPKYIETIIIIENSPGSIADQERPLVQSKLTLQARLLHISMTEFWNNPQMFRRLHSYQLFCESIRSNDQQQSALDSRQVHFPLRHKLFRPLKSQKFGRNRLLDCQWYRMGDT